MTLFAKSVPYCDVPLKERGHDPKKAAEILDAAGWKAGADGIRTKDGARLVLDFYFNSNNAQEKTIAEAMQGDLLKIGVELRVIGEEKQAFLDRPAHRANSTCSTRSPGARRTTRRAISPPGAFPRTATISPRSGLPTRRTSTRPSRPS